MSEKCFCHLNGYKVKDADARAQLSAHDVAIKGLSEGITELSEKVESAGGGGGKLYHHNVNLVGSNNDKLVISIWSSTETKFTKEDIANLYQCAHSVRLIGMNTISNLWKGEAAIMDSYYYEGSLSMDLLVYAFKYDFTFSAEYVSFTVSSITDVVTEV